jgi:polyphenol oxidase
MLQSRPLAALPGIRHAFFTRAGGVSQGVYASLNGGLGSDDQPNNVKENRARMAAILGVSRDRLLTAYQIHSPAVAVVEQPWSENDRPRVDAIVTKTTGLAIAVSTADCGPVLLSDSTARVVGAAHAGWRGALAGVLEATVDAMVRLGADRARIVAALGPMIRQQNYEVGPDLVTKFVAADPDNVKFFTPAAKPNHAMFDLAGYICMRLAHAGLSNIDDLQACTYADPAQFFSFRRTTHRGEPDYGRHINAIALIDWPPPTLLHVKQ